jgi:hypothetical protein
MSKMLDSASMSAETGTSLIKAGRVNRVDSPTDSVMSDILDRSSNLPALSLALMV